MRRTAILLLLPAAGCSTAPIAGLMDCVRPSRATVLDPRPERGPERLPPATDKGDPFLDPPRFDK